MKDKKVYRVGTNWGGVDVFQHFKKFKIAFVGFEVENYVLSTKTNDILIITKGSTIIALADVVGLADLSEVSVNLSNEFDDVKCLKLGNIFLQEDYPKVNFGSYGGQGKQFHIAHGDYAKNAIDSFSKIINTKMNQEIVALLKYKKQIVLQGPPGTGKTKLAGEIAESLIAPKNLGSPKQVIEDYIKHFDSSLETVLSKREELNGLLEAFQEKFKKENLNKITLEEYAFGMGTNDSFCWWLEYVLYGYGQYAGFAGKFLIYWKKESQSYVKSGFVKDIEDDEVAMEKLAEQLFNVANNQNLLEVSKYLGKGLMLKILNSYYPELYFPISNETCINNALKLLGFDHTGLNFVDKNKKLQEIFLEKKKKLGSEISNVEFMNFLFSTYDMKGDIELQKDEVVSKGEFEIVQFHPSYTYEDFVRGIVSKSNNQNQIEFIVENKVLSIFAQKALDNPNSNYVLILDEINRANLSAVLGELIFALEYRFDKDKAKHTTVRSMYTLKEHVDDDSGTNELRLPKNLYIIGTMNTADRSVGHIDYAIRRRFAFVDVLPKDLSKEPDIKFDSILFNKVASLFDDHITSDFNKSEVQLGHSYFIDKSEEGGDMGVRLKYEIKPILEEYIKDGILKEAAREVIRNLA
ncbi:McrB family protein [Pedobacter sp. R20-19]|uniref:McrB family protein n=1 Tax=Pedobacter sp. R20-19 TaxID=1270196 RepID=UPI0006897EDF|nr:AAA family ATPase [Pedobacter sp. R20-19]